MIFCAVSADVIIPPVVPVVNPVITVTQGCQWLVCICVFLYLFVLCMLIFPLVPLVPVINPVLRACAPWHLSCNH